MPAKLSDRIRYEKRLYRLNNRKREWLEEMAVEAEALENANNRLADENKSLKDKQEVRNFGALCKDCRTRNRCAVEYLYPNCYTKGEESK